MRRQRSKKLSQKRMEEQNQNSEKSNPQKEGQSQNDKKTQVSIQIKSKLQEVEWKQQNLATVRKTHQLPTLQPAITVVNPKKNRNANSNFTIWVILIYCLTVVYTVDVYMLIIPFMSTTKAVHPILMVQYALFFAISTILMIVSYEKARKRSPGYVGQHKMLYSNQIIVKQNDTYISPEDIQILKAHSQQLLVKRLNLQEQYKQTPNDQNIKAFQAFELKYFTCESKFCEQCNYVKPPRFRHCSSCNRCIQRMDHHCIWLNNCVGKRNHKLFFLFLMYLQFSLMMIWIIALVDVFDKNFSIGYEITIKYGNIFRLIHQALGIASVVLWLYYIFVFIQQIYLIVHNLTFVQSLTKFLRNKQPWKNPKFAVNWDEVFGKFFWLCPTIPVFDSDYVYASKRGNNKENRSHRPQQQLVEQVYTETDNYSLKLNRHFDSAHHLKQDRVDL